MVRTKRIAWWLAPAVLVMVFDAWLAIHEVTGGSLLGTVDPRAEIRSTAAGIWLALAVATAVGLAFSARRPGLAGGLIIIGSLPAAMLVWSPLVMIAGLASCAGAIYHLARTGARVDRAPRRTGAARSARIGGPCWTMCEPFATSDTDQGSFGLDP